MKILKLISENVKGLKAVEITPRQDTVVISGGNGQGKTSVLDSIEYALAGKASFPEEPIRQGQQKARIVCDLGDLVVERTFSATSGDSQLRVKTKDGKPAKSPQQMLDQLCNLIAFDPLQFTRMKPQEQVETLQKLVGLDFTDLNTRRRQAYDEREATGRLLKAAKVKLETFTFDPAAPEQEVSAKDLTTALQGAREHNQAGHKAKLELDAKRQQVKQQEERRDQYQALINDLEHKLTEARRGFNSTVIDLQSLRREADSLEASLAGFQWQDEQTVAKQLDDVNAVNAKVAARRRHEEQNAEVQKFQQAYDRLTFTIEQIDQEKRDQIEWAEFPLPGLGFSDSRVEFEGVPFSQVNQAKQLQVAVAIGLALNPKVRVILIRDASLLDDQSMKLVGELAAKHDAQIWMEVVNSKDPSAVVIEAGEVKP